MSPWRDSGPLPLLVFAALKKRTGHNRRAAAEAIGRIGDKWAVPALLEAAGNSTDRVLEHSLTYALIEIGDPESTAKGLKSSNPSIRRAALTALDQMERGGLGAKTVAA